eukprot:TRINITY_DN1868_c0_g1_i1.p1 TRINITY_DN1868_c0_g1~~TRINITY_DN1868_c0_g1_i1.p1  ORF type:complete len:331 (+),score=65.12 TRINITY_DN1868_c0_g1_i1:664-1656(+)
MLQELQDLLVPVEPKLQFIKRRWGLHEGYWLPLQFTDPARREAFLGSLLLNVMTALEEINIPAIKEVIRARLDIPADQIVRISHQRVTFDNIFLDPVSNTLRLGDLTSLSPVFHTLSPGMRTVVSATPDIAPPELLLDDAPVLTSRSGHFMAAVSVWYLINSHANTKFPTAKDLTEQLELPEASPVIQVLLGCLQPDPLSAMPPQEIMQHLSVFDAKLSGQEIMKILRNMATEGSPCADDPTRGRGMPMGPNVFPGVLAYFNIGSLAAKRRSLVASPDPPSESGRPKVESDSEGAVGAVESSLIGEYDLGDDESMDVDELSDDSEAAEGE